MKTLYRFISLINLFSTQIKFITKIKKENPIKYLNVTLRHLRTFITVAEQGSFNGAAEKLSRTQPAITLAIKQLEEFIGLKLLERTTRQVSTTTEGQNFIPIAQRLVRDFDTAIYDHCAVLR